MKCALAAVLTALILSTAVGAADFQFGKGANLVSGSVSLSAWDGRIYEQVDDGALLKYSLEIEAVHFFWNGFGIGPSFRYAGDNDEYIDYRDVAIGVTMLYTPAVAGFRTAPYFSVTGRYLSQNSVKVIWAHYYDYWSGYDYEDFYAAQYDLDGYELSLGAGLMVKLGEHVFLNNRLTGTMHQLQRDSWGNHRVGRIWALSTGLSYSLF